jgi:hypothetical protein
MQEFIVHFFSGLKSLDWHAILSLAILGIILIIANAVTHYIKERITSRMRDAHAAKEIIDQSLEPMKRRADDLIARLCTLLIGWSHLEEMRAVKNFLSSGGYENRLQSLQQDQLVWLEVVAFRILEFQWSVHRFRTFTQSLINNPQIGEIEYFVVDKLPLVLRGRVYGTTFFSREEEEEMAHFFPTDINPVEGPTMKELVAALRTGKEHRRLFEKLVQYLAFDKPEIVSLSEGNFHDQDVKRHCNLTHYTIYLIDLFQKLAHSSKWEEYRVLLVRMLRRLNETRDIKVYLYYPIDLEQRSYLFSYPEDILESNVITRLLTRMHGNPFSMWRGLGFRWCLNRRSKRFIHRHHRKRIDKKGVRIVANNRRHDLFLSKSLSDIHGDLIRYFESSGRRLPPPIHYGR